MEHLRAFPSFNRERGEKEKKKRKVFNRHRDLFFKSVECTNVINLGV